MNSLVKLVQLQLLYERVAGHVDAAQRRGLPKRLEDHVGHRLGQAKTANIEMRQILIILDDVLEALGEVCLFLRHFLLFFLLIGNFNTTLLYRFVIGQ